MNQVNVQLYGITDSHWVGKQTLTEQVREALERGVTILQYREKHLQQEEYKQQAIELQALCRERNVPFIINDNVEFALEINADGVHLGQKDMTVSEARSLLGSDKIIGVSARTVEQARAAEAGGADYLGSGAVFGTNTKEDAMKLPKQTLCDICQAVSIPVVAIGGITIENIDELKGCGISGAAVISAIFGQENIGEATERLKEKLMEIC